MQPDWIPSFIPNEHNAYSINWNAVFDVFPVLRELEAVPQDPAFHSEGDVLTHTGMVMEHLTSDEAWRRLDAVARCEVWLAALLHDVGKLRTTEVLSDGSVRSPKHSYVGERVVRELLYKSVDISIPFASRERIVRYIRYHGLPLWFMEKENQKKAIVIPSQMINMHHLYLVASADVYGRISDDRENLIDKVELFKTYCEELHCLTGPYQFPDSYSRFLYARNSQRDSNYQAYDDTWGVVTLMSGLPGAGKDTWIEAHTPGFEVISLDTIRNELGISPDEKQGTVIQTAKQKARELLRAKIPFIWNSTNISRSLRQSLIELFHNYNAKTKIVYIECNYTELVDRNKEREKAVPTKILDKLIKKLEVPDSTEAVEVVYYSK